MGGFATLIPAANSVPESHVASHSHGPGVRISVGSSLRHAAHGRRLHRAHDGGGDTWLQTQKGEDSGTASFFGFLFPAVFMKDV